MPTGKASGVVVVDRDVDPAKDLDGLAAFEVLRAGRELPATREARSPRGGSHLYFKCPEGRVPNSEGKLARGVDVRGDGGYIVLPPSHTEPGEKTVLGDYTWLSQAKTAPLPDWLRELLVGQPAPSLPVRAPASEQEARIRSALACIPASNRNVWRDTGFALKAELGDAGWPLFDDWSRTAPDAYNANENRKQWLSFKPEGGITIGTLFHMARKNCWQEPRPPRTSAVHAGLPTDEVEFARLATLPLAQYDRERTTAAARLGIRTSTLDAEVIARRPAAAGKVQGGAVEFPHVEPWPQSVDGAEVLSAVAATFRRYVALPATTADALALWIAHAHGFEAFQHSPRLNLASPEKQCGKTLVLDVAASLLPRPLRTESITPAVLFRLVELHKPCLLLDEVDTYLDGNDELRGLLNAGHKRGAKAYRCEGDGNEVRGFNAFAPAVLAGIGTLPGTLHDRSVVVRLVRAKSGEVPARFDSRRTAAEAALCRQLARWTTDNLAHLESCDPAMPGAFNRLADNWRPLFAVAEVAGDDWPQRAAAALAALTGGDDQDAHGIGTALLADVRTIFAAAGTDRLPSARIVEALASLDGKPWPEFGKAGKPISANQLARLLTRFAIHSRTIRTGENTAKGYHREDFEDAFARYLPDVSLRAKSPTRLRVKITRL